jgi:hypothetical protein
MSPQQPQTPQKATTFTDHEALSDAIDDWDLRNWHFNAFVLVVPSAEAPYMVAGTDPLACQMLADDAVRACCNASQRLKAAWGPWGPLTRSWTGTVCDMSAVRDGKHPRNYLAEAILTAIAIGDSLASYNGPLRGTVGFHLTGELPGAIEQERAVRKLKMAADVWRNNPNPTNAR